MRVFWATLVLLALIAGGWVYVTRVNQSKAGDPEADAQIAAKNAAFEKEMAAKTPVTPKPAETVTSSVTPPVSTSPSLPDKPIAPEAKPAAEVPTAPAATSGSIARDPATAQAAVVRVDFTGSDGRPLSQRAGFLMAADLVVTPAHLLDQAISATVSIAGAPSVPVIGSVVLDQARDIAILKLATPPAAPTVLKFSTREARTDEPGFVIPASGASTMQAAILGYRTDTVQGRRVQIRAALPANPVGMPLVMESGELVGLVTGKDPSGAALVVSAAEIAGLPRGKVVALTTTAAAATTARNDGKNDKPPTPTDGTGAKEAKPEIASEAKVEKQADGSVLVDGKYVVKGEGTKEKPYEVTWEMLVSVQDDYDPRKGQKKLPGRIMILDGKWVKMTGYVAFPLAVEDPKELLSMLNQWDGCCIGVPPTPYDAIEVRLGDSVPKDDRLATFGAVTGKLSVKPYLVGEWLVGLYIMDDAKLSVKQFGGFGS